MTLQLTLPPELETKLRQHAERLGVDINTFVLQAIEEKLARVEAEQKRRAAKARKAQQELQRLVVEHPAATHFVDDSRESIYEGRGE